MPGLKCNACNREFQSDSEQRLHYKSDWHRYNLKRKVAGVPGVNEALFQARHAALVHDNEISQTPMSYSCGLCGKEYRSTKAYSQHLNSRTHIARASQLPADHSDNIAIVKPIQRHAMDLDHDVNEVEDSDDEWVEAGSEDENIDGISEGEDVMDEDEEGFVLDPCNCFMCDKKHQDIESCMVHMHKFHGFFIPDVEYLKDARGLLSYLGLKVRKDHRCLYCNDRCQPFSSLEAVRKHMEAKSHCKVHYGDSSNYEEVELEEFYDYSSSYLDEGGKQLVELGDLANKVELGSGGSELIITKQSRGKISAKVLGSREFLRFYQQNPRPSPTNDSVMVTALALRYKSMGLATVHSKADIIRMKAMKEMARSGVDSMRTKIGMKSNVIRNLPKNVPY